MRKRQLVSSIAIMSVMWGATAFAQEADDEAMEELIVTATKRSERMIDVPISMSAMGADSIAETGIRELKEVAEFIPNLHITSSNDFRQAVYIRGVGAHSRNIGFDTRVGVYVDGVYMGQSPALNQELLDLERVEVLRGPQGTLFGKNTVAGAINLITKKPGDEFEGEASLSYGNHDYLEMRGIVNVPLSDTMAAKFSISKTDRDGYVTNTVTGNKLGERDVLAYRAQLRIQASEQLEINASFDGLESNSLVFLGDPSSDTFGYMPNLVESDRDAVAFSKDPYDKRNVKGGALDITYDLDNGHTFKSITGYRDTDGFQLNDTDYSPYDFLHVEFHDTFKQFSQEFQFISPDEGPLTYMAGAYYYDQKSWSMRDAILGADILTDWFTPYIYTLYMLGVGPFAPYSGTPLEYPAMSPEVLYGGVGFGPAGSSVYNTGEVNTKTVAAYFNGNYEFSEKLKLGFGARYSEEKKDVNWTSDGCYSGLFAIGTTGPCGALEPLLENRKDKHFSPAISMTYAVGERANVYAKYSGGYKSGGFNLDFINAAEMVANPSLAFDKETVQSFEAGFKGVFMDGKMTFNSAVFLANYDDYQVNQFVDLGGGRTAIRITNAAKVETKGFEADFTYNATETLTFTGSLGLLSAKFDSFPEGGTGGTDASGNRLVNAPKINASFSAQYFKNVPSLNANLLVRGDLTHSGGYYTTANNDKAVPYNLTPLQTQYEGTMAFGYLPANTQMHARIGLLSENDTWELYFWARNLTNEKKYTDELRDFFGTIARYPQMGRQYGFELVRKF